MRNKNKITTLLFVLLACSISYAQVGIGTEQPTYDFEVKGTVRFRDLEAQSPYTHYRQVRSDSEGHLTAIQHSPSGMDFENIAKSFMTSPVAIAVGSSARLGLELNISLTPHTETTVVLTYNIPIYLNTAISNVIPHFGGIQVMRTLGNSATFLYGASRKFSFPISYPAGSEVKRGMFLDGKYVDVLRNDTDDYVTYTYSLIGFVEGSSSTTVYFSDTPGEFVNTMGVGVLSAMKLSKKI